MKHTYNLKNNTTLIIRNPHIKDLDKSYEFFMSFPESKRRFFRSDVINKEHIKERIEDSEKHRIIRRIALINDKIVGDASLEIDTDTWKSGTAYLRLVIPEGHRGKGIQYIMASDLVEIATEKHLDKIVAKFMRPQNDLMDIYKSLGFTIEGMLHDYVKDLKGKEQDLVIMVVSLKNLRKAYNFVGDWLDNEHSIIGPGEM
ncbi:MAG: GNAT family N-acetyltransferase [Candidatus Marinimicrobia bacterium]|jgi:RimJ/RimL family protein N-acetyltransferase|nr:GNAT family N-acetyltransferase [Candidatus Neomarinimicrobiota bacterium]|tara:strand:- start:311 stop:913 length:603 start_codon:yes stop_codon:yes gene_type:complete